MSRPYKLLTSGLTHLMSKRVNLVGGDVEVGLEVGGVKHPQSHPGRR